MTKSRLCIFCGKKSRSGFCKACRSKSRKMQPFSHFVGMGIKKRLTFKNAVRLAKKVYYYQG